MEQRKSWKKLITIMCVFLIPSLWIMCVYHQNRMDFETENNKPIVRLYGDDYSLPDIEFIIRTVCIERLTTETKMWLDKSIKLFWFLGSRNITYVLDSENRGNKNCIDDIKNTYMRPKIKFRDPKADRAIYKNTGRYRMIYDYFFAEELTASQYVPLSEEDLALKQQCMCGLLQLNSS